LDAVVIAIQFEMSERKALSCHKVREQKMFYTHLKIVNNPISSA